MSEPALHGDLTRTVVVDSTRLEWTPSPSRTVWRRRLHRVGPPESGQVTSIVRYEPGASFPSHGHPGGEEILVLEGVFSDETGDWPAGWYLLNPEGFRHAPRSREGCRIFVKLRQYPGADRARLRLDTGFRPGEVRPVAGIETHDLYRQPGFLDRARVEVWAPGANPGSRVYPDGAEILVLAGRLRDEHGEHGAETWLRFPARARHHPRSPGGCELYVKEGGFAYLRPA